MNAENVPADVVWFPFLDIRFSFGALPILDSWEASFQSITYLTTV